MRRYSNFFLVFALVLLAVSCKPDPPIDPDDDQDTEVLTTLNIRLNPVVGGQGFALNTPYTGPNGYTYELSLLKFYISNVELIKTDNSRLPVKSAFLYNWAKSDMQSVCVAGDSGTYKGIAFGLGLSPDLNSSDPNTFETDHPLSVLQGTYWNWASMYRFVMIDGRADTTGTGSPIDAGIVYHTGMDTLYREIVLDNRPFTLTYQQAHDFDLNLDLNLVFYGQDTVDFKTEPFTHTTSNFELAEKVTDNFVNALW